MAQLILDSVLLLLLAGLFIAVPRWLKKVEALSRLKTDLEALSLQFVRATTDAALAIEELKSVTAKEQSILQAAQNRALATADDLDILRKRAEQTCTRIEEALHKSRASATSNVAPTQSLKPATPLPKSKAESELLEALRHAAP
ncbi:MAG: hypothetical protein LW855_08665 [Alphaproteobacteria bacterium]|jgi:biopolymer transport protein ExbB/TolQ|nr:hypothetical protein [Thalassospira sp.]MCE2965849.1 hypothetical protein [Alphaproteobacteria bacterium]